MSIQIMVTGAAGFIGSHLCERLLEEGYNVTGVDNFDPFYKIEIKKKNLASLLGRKNKFTFIEGDVSDLRMLNAINDKPDVVIHLAAKPGVLPSIKNPIQYVETNIHATNVLMEWMVQKGIKKLLFASSSSVYGNSAVPPFKEGDVTDQPISPYAYTKKACELMTYAYHVNYDIDTINMRFFTVFGERQRPDLAIHKFVKKIMNGESIQLYGDGSTCRDYTYISDTIAGIIGALQYIKSSSNVYESVNFGNSNPVSLIDLVNNIYQILGISPKIEYLPRQMGDVEITYADISKANQLFNYKPETEFSYGLKKFIDWFNS